MRELLKNTIAPNTSLCIIMLAISFFNTYLSIRISTDGWNNFMTGLVYSAYYAGMMIGGLYIERLMALTGHIRAFAIFAAITAASIIMQSFTTSPIVWMFYRFIAGFACAGLFIVIESWLLLLSTTNTRGTVLSIYMIALYTAQTLGQFLINVAPIQALTPFNLAVLLSILSIIPVCLMRAAAPSLLESEYLNIFYLLKKVPLGFLGDLISGLILSSFYALGPVFGKEIGLSIWQISCLMAITIFGGMALQWPIGFLSDIIERKKILIYISLILCITSLIIYFLKIIPFYALLLILFIYGGFAFTLYPVSISYCCDFFSASGITSVTSAALIVYGVGCIFGPLAAPIVMSMTKPSGLFLYSGILSFILLLSALYSLYKTPLEPKESKEHYQMIPPTTPTATQLDPRREDDLTS